jgi:S1-C subfamily serine protease
LVRLATVAVVGLLAGVAGAALTAVALLGSDAFQTTTETTVAAPVANPIVVAPLPAELPPPVRTEIITPSAEPATAAAVGAKVLPSIVTVEIGDVDSQGEFLITASGSGVVLTADGLVVTNHHVIENAERTQVVFRDGRILEATIVGSDPVTDLALLRVDSDSLVPIDRGSSETLVIGDPAIAVGSPLGLAGGPSLTAGVVSALDREVVISNEPNGVLYGMLQTDAPITRGSSGGALLDGAGRLIGITTAIGVSDAGAEGIGFAIPVELVTRVIDEILETGEVKHAFLGVLLDDVFVTEGPLQTPAGAVIVEFVPDSAAEAAGLRVGDQIIGFEGNRVDTKEHIIIKLRRYRVGEPVHFIVVRDGATLEFDVVLGERPADLQR